jgi:hypothetical protein
MAPRFRSSSSLPLASALTNYAQKLSAIAKKYGIGLMYGYAERSSEDPNDIYNSLVRLAISLDPLR